MAEPKQSVGVRPFVVGIPTYNRYDLLDECIASVLANSVVPVKIVVIDNGGDYRPTSERVEVVRPCRNLGVAASWNLLHKLAEPLELVICNDDLRLGRKVLESLLECPAPMATAYGWSCFRQRHEVWRIVGDYDETFFAYHEDNDYSYRLKLAGVERRDVEHDGITHHGSATIKSMNGRDRADFNERWEHGRRYYQDKWGGLPEQERFLSPFNQVAKSARTLEEARADAYRRARTAPSDIHEHVAVLYELARQCGHVTELGRGHGNSTIAFIHAAPATFVSYDVNPLTDDEALKVLAGKNDVRLLQGDSRAIDIEPTDLLFIDTHQTCAQLKCELARHGNKARKYIVLHDTVTWGLCGCDGTGGILPAIEEFLAASPFEVERSLANNNGLMVLKKRETALTRFSHNRFH